MSESSEEGRGKESVKSHCFSDESPRTEENLLCNFSGHAHWVNTLALNTDAVLRRGAFDSQGKLKAVHTAAGKADASGERRIGVELRSKNLVHFLTEVFNPFCDLQL